MSGFAALLKLSQTQTAQSELEVQTQIASHQLQLEKKRREQEVKERKERELEAKLRAKRFEEERKEEERKRKRAEEESAKERELAKREEQMRHALKYGPRRATGAAWGSAKGRGSDVSGDRGGPALTREELRKRQNESSDASVLTREEKRERRLAAELRRTSSASSRRSNGGTARTASLPDGRTVRRLPGGAVDYTTVSRLADPDAPPPLATGDLAGKSARERLAAMPSTLLKLNTVKRDVRTIDEILIDRAKAKQAKVLAGDEAKEFSDWFGKNKKKERPASQSTSQQRPASTTSSRAISATPPSASPGPTINPFSNAAASKVKPSTLSTTPSKPSSPFLKPINPKANPVSRPSATTPSPLLSSKKRPRSPSESDTTRPPIKRHISNSSRPAATSRLAATSSRSSTLPNEEVDISTAIWSIFGKDKKSYTARDVLSDDEDMEADAESVLREEARSARLAQKEDEYALAEERRHEEEKRKRKKERDRKEKV